MAGIIPLGYQTGVYDSALMGILQDCVKLPQFLDSVFSFLARRTDFYIIMEHEKAKMGFHPGVAESMVIQAFKKYEVLTRKREAEIQHEKETKRLESLDETPPEEEEEVHIQDELPITLPESANHPVADDSAKSKKKSVKTADAQKKERKDVPALSKAEVEDWEKVSDIYNGAQMENYKWSQTITDIDVRVPVPEGTTAKNLKVDIRSDHLKVVLFRPTQQTLIDKPLLHKIKVEESLWSVDKDRSLLTINLEKTKEIMWKSVLQGEDGIDLSKVDTTRDISEFDPECQAAIQRVTYDEHMKRLGKPTSGQKKAHDMLKKAWDAEGSPFKGTPFDPTRVQISGDFNELSTSIREGVMSGTGAPSQQSHNAIQATARRLEKLQLIEQDISRMLSLASGAIEELSKDSPSGEMVEYKTKDFVKTVEGIEKKLNDEIQYLSQVSTSQAHEGSVYGAEKDFELGVLQISLARERLLRYKTSEKAIDSAGHGEGSFS